MSRESIELMWRAMLATAAAAGHTVDYGPLNEVREILRTHGLNCSCDVCMAFVNGSSAATGMLAAMEVLDKKRAD